MSFSFATRVALVGILSLRLVSPQTPAPSSTPDTPVGHWVAEHTSKGGIGSWWDFRADGTLTMHVGAAVTSPITRSGNSFMSPSGTVGGPLIKVTFRVEGETLHLATSDDPDRIFLRVGPAPSATDPLLGKWRPVPPAVPSADPAKAAQEKAMVNTLYVFSADNTESVRIPFVAFEGTWDAVAHTFKVQSRPGTFSFRRSGLKLALGQPPDGHETDTYVVDPIF